MGLTLSSVLALGARQAGAGDRLKWPDQVAVAGQQPAARDAVEGASQGCPQGPERYTKSLAVSGAVPVVAVAGSGHGAGRQWVLLAVPGRCRLWSGHRFWQVGGHCHILFEPVVWVLFTYPMLVMTQRSLMTRR